MIVLQAAWVCSLGGIKALNGWVMKVTNSPPDRAIWPGWIEILLLVCALLAVLIVSWRKQGYGREYLVGVPPYPSNMTAVKRGRTLAKG
jgi:hypothetical protein